MKRTNILRAIDEKELWLVEAAEVAVVYMKENVNFFLEGIICDWLQHNSIQWNVDISMAMEQWKVFLGSEDGVTETIARKTKNKIKRKLNDGSEKRSKGISFEAYSNIVQQVALLAGNYKVWYGRTEAQMLLNALREVSAVDSLEIDYSYEITILHYYLKYKMAMENENNIKSEAALLAEIKEGLSAAQQMADKKVIHDFISVLNDGTDISITEEEYEALFA